MTSQTNEEGMDGLRANHDITDYWRLHYGVHSCSGVWSSALHGMDVVHGRVGDPAALSGLLSTAENKQCCAQLVDKAFQSHLG